MNGIGTVCAGNERRSRQLCHSIPAAKCRIQCLLAQPCDCTVRSKNVTGQAEPQPCGSDRDINDARAVCDRLGIPYRVYDFGQLFRDTVIRNFAEEYASGRTPNPCVLCNKVLKFGALTNAARADSADAVATGHYARVEHDAGGRYLLKCATDAARISPTCYGARIGNSCRAHSSAWRSTKREVRKLPQAGGLSRRTRATVRTSALFRTEITRHF